MAKNSTKLRKILAMKSIMNSFYGTMITPKNSPLNILLYLKYKRPVGFIERRNCIYVDTDSIYIKQDEVTK